MKAHVRAVVSLVRPVGRVMAAKTSGILRLPRSGQRFGHRIVPDGSRLERGIRPAEQGFCERMVDVP